MSVPFGDWITKFPESSRTAAVSPPPAEKLFLVVQIVWPVESNNTRSELLVKTSFPGIFVVIGLSRLAIHKYVRSGMLLYHMPTYELEVEFFREKKPIAKTPPSDMSTSPGKSGFAGVNLSSDWHKQTMNRKMKAGK